LSSRLNVGREEGNAQAQLMRSSTFVEVDEVTKETEKKQSGSQEGRTSWK
jgi:hypothetical protein